MYKVKVVIDEERLVKDGKYNLERYKEAIDKLFLEDGIYKEDEYYIGEGKKGQLENMWASISILWDKKWFAEYIKEWKWYSDVIEKGVFRSEDLLEEVKRLKLGAFANGQLA